LERGRDSSKINISGAGSGMDGEHASVSASATQSKKIQRGFIKRERRMEIHVNVTVTVMALKK